MLEAWCAFDTRYESVCFWGFMNKTSRYVLTSIEDIKQVTSSVLGVVQHHSALSEERRYDIMLVINELLVNSFEHAQPTEKTPVVFRVDIVDSELHIGVSDGGKGFEYEPKAAQTDEALYRERGRGLMIVRALCEDIKYNCCGNTVKVRIAL